MYTNYFKHFFTQILFTFLQAVKFFITSISKDLIKVFIGFQGVENLFHRPTPSFCHFAILQILSCTSHCIYFLAKFLKNVCSKCCVIKLLSWTYSIVFSFCSLESFVGCTAASRSGKVAARYDASASARLWRQLASIAANRLRGSTLAGGL